MFAIHISCSRKYHEMKWKQKAKIQNLIAKLPATLSYRTYFLLQRKFGALKKLNPTNGLLAGVVMLDYINGLGQTIDSKTFLEIGTGPTLRLPIALWLCGASDIMTVDPNPYLKEELVFGDISYMSKNRQSIQTLFGKYSENPVFQERFDKLLGADINLKKLLDTMNVRYLPKADARWLDLPDQSIDFCVSRSVFEHIPLPILKDILLETKRILKKTGLSSHSINFADHFSITDNSISTINFLQFSEKQWSLYNDNRFAYHNRLRIDDFMDLFNNIGLKILSSTVNVDQKALQMLKDGFPLDENFRNKSEETNATQNMSFVARFE